MREVVHFSTYDVRGGAASAARRLHHALLDFDVQSLYVFAAQPSSQGHCTAKFEPMEGFMPRLREKLRREAVNLRRRRIEKLQPSGVEIFTDDRSGFKNGFSKYLSGDQIGHIHWTSGFFSLSRFVGKSAIESPLVFTLHDMNTFTGGCHYTEGCEAFRDHCGRCPQLGSNSTRDLAYSNFARKERAFRTRNPANTIIVCPSRWMAARASESRILQGQRIEVVPYGIDGEVFSPRDRSSIRTVLGIPDDHTAILFVADSIEIRRKGMDLLLEALNSLSSSSGIILITVGGGEIEGQVRFPRIHLGRIESEYLMSQIYSAADIFVAPSRQDNLPNTVLEAMACGTAVVAFATGGMEDMVQNNVSGILVDSIDARSLASGIQWLLERPESRQEMGDAGRRQAILKFSPEQTAKRYIELYESFPAGRLGS